jgi:hypothetical protein
LALGRLRADPAAARRDMHRATFAIVIVVGLSGKRPGPAVDVATLDRRSGKP